MERDQCRKCGARRIDSQIGLEKTPAEYIARLVAEFEEVRRVLRKDGTCWVNIGDSYNAHPGQTKTTDLVGPKQATNSGSHAIGSRSVSGVKPKDLLGIPWMLAFALRDAGWYLRSEIIWHKPNPMPESVTDRPTKAHEQLFLLAKSKSYFYDAEAIAEIGVGREVFGNSRSKGDCADRRDNDRQDMSLTALRNRRSVWTVATEAFEGAHFATYPTKLIEPCILAGTSAEGCCAECGAPKRRIVERTDSTTERSDNNGKNSSEDPQAAARRMLSSLKRAREASGDHGNPFTPKATIGWQPSCKCNAASVPCTVLDPFMGSGTTGEVALKHGRAFIGIELSAEYMKLAEKRIGAMRQEVESEARFFTS